MRIDGETLARAITTHGDVVLVDVIASIGADCARKGDRMIVWADGHQGDFDPGEITPDILKYAHKTMERLIPKAMKLHTLNPTAAPEDQQKLELLYRWFNVAGNHKADLPSLPSQFDPMHDTPTEGAN